MRKLGGRVTSSRRKKFESHLMIFATSSPTSMVRPSEFDRSPLCFIYLIK